jgi:DNA polymerase III chi subunit HolC
VTQVDFYIVESDSEDARLKIVCRIADKANDASQHVFIHGCSDVEAKKLDELLWTLSQGSFIPHKIVRDGADAAPAGPGRRALGPHDQSCAGRAGILQPLPSRGGGRRRRRDETRAEPRPLPFLSRPRLHAQYASGVTRMAREPGESIPILTDVILSGTPTPPQIIERDALVAELQTKIAARTFALTDEVLRAAFAEMEASLYERISARLRRELPEIIDAALREHLGEDRA